MFDHVTLRTEDIDSFIEFYQATLGVLGYTLQVKQDFEGGIQLVGFGTTDHVTFWCTNEHPQSSSLHLAFHAQSRAIVDEWYQVGLQFGAKDNGAPGAREEYGVGYYAAYLIDSRGYRLEAVSRE
jgi:catechol 2,3-dioxygenase-like lactoylglutathione lyase family enzyme